MSFTVVLKSDKVSIDSSYAFIKLRRRDINNIKLQTKNIEALFDQKKNNLLRKTICLMILDEEGNTPTKLLLKDAGTYDYLQLLYNGNVT